MLAVITRLGVVLLALATMFLLLPSSEGLPTEAVSAVETAFGYLYAWDYIFPVQTLLTILKLSIAFQLMVFGWRFFKWITHLISAGSAGSS
jgi:hypothetical protein